MKWEERKGKERRGGCGWTECGQANLLLRISSGCLRALGLVWAAKAGQASLSAPNEQRTPPRVGRQVRPTLGGRIFGRKRWEASYLIRDLNSKIKSSSLLLLSGRRNWSRLYCRHCESPLQPPTPPPPDSQRRAGNKMVPLFGLSIVFASKAPRWRLVGRIFSWPAGERAREMS